MSLRMSAATVWCYAFGGEVMPGAQHAAVGRRGAVAGPAGEPQVQERHVSRRGEENVARLHVAVHPARRIQRPPPRPPGG